MGGGGGVKRNVTMSIWGGSRGGSGGSVEAPKVKQTQIF